MSETGELVQKPIPTCENHPSDEVDVYCKDCAKAICFTCSRSHHRDHDCEGIARLTRILRQEIPEFCKQMRDGTLNRMKSELELIQLTKQANKEKFDQDKSANDLLQNQIIQKVKEVFKTNAVKSSDKLSKQNEELTAREKQLTKEIDDFDLHLQTHQDSRLTYGKWEIMEMDENLKKMAGKYVAINTDEMKFTSCTRSHLTTKQEESLKEYIQSILLKSSGDQSSETAEMNKTKYPTSVQPLAKHNAWFDEKNTSCSKNWFDEEGTLSDPILSISNAPSSQIKMPVYFISMITTSSDMDSSLLQLSVLTPFMKRNWYVKPSKPVSIQVQEVTGIKYVNGEMYVSEKQVRSFQPRQVLQCLLDILEKKPAYIIGHNLKSHCCYAIIEAATPIGLNERLMGNLTHMVDIISLFRYINRRMKAHLTPEELSERILGKNIIRNDAAADITALKHMYEELNPTEDTIKKCMFDYKYVMNAKRMNEEKITNLKSWQPLITEGRISKKIAKKAARNGFHVWDLYKAFEDGGEDKIASIMSEKDDTNTTKISDKKETIHQLCHYFKKLSSENG